ncbi:MAG: hypothetical protein NT080_09235 [Spirochaetes bacterium]|nr:hypothetical protein [Spirochaetota bacterium]
MKEIIDTVAAAWASLPSMVVALLTLPAGWLFALLSRFLVAGFLSLLGVDRIAKRTGAAEFLRKGGVEYSLSRLVGVLAYWAVLVAVLVRLAIILDVRLVASLYERVVELFPSLLAAVLVVAIGAVIVGFLANFAMTIARNAASRHPQAIGRAIKWAGNALVILIALDQVGLGRSILSTALLVLLAAASFGAALAFGLGCSTMAKEAATRFLRELRERDRGGKGSDLEG